MAKFIKVHDADDNTVVLINTDDITYVAYDAELKKPVIRMANSVKCVVHETIDKIYEMIQA